MTATSLCSNQRVAREPKELENIEKNSQKIPVNNLGTWQKKLTLSKQSKKESSSWAFIRKSAN